MPVPVRSRVRQQSRYSSVCLVPRDRWSGFLTIRSYGILTIVSSRSPVGGPHVGAMMRLAWQGVWKKIFSGVVAAGYQDVNPAHVGLFRYPGLDGQRPS